MWETPADHNRGRYHQNVISRREFERKSLGKRYGYKEKCWENKSPVAFRADKNGEGPDSTGEKRAKAKNRRYMKNQEVNAFFVKAKDTYEYE